MKHHVNLERVVYDAIESGLHSVSDILGYVRKTDAGAAHPNPKRAVPTTLKKLAKQNMVQQNNKKWSILR